MLTDFQHRAALECHSHHKPKHNTQVILDNLFLLHFIAARIRFFSIISSASDFLSPDHLSLFGFFFYEIFSFKFRHIQFSLVFGFFFSLNFFIRLCCVVVIFVFSEPIKMAQLFQRAEAPAVHIVLL